MVRGRISDQEWSFFEPFVVSKGPKSGRPASDHRLILDGVFWIARTGASWRDLPQDFGKWSSVYRQFRRWSISGLWDAMLEALNASSSDRQSVQMVDSTVIRAHQHAAGGKGGLKNKISAVREVACRPKSI